MSTKLNLKKGDLVIAISEFDNNYKIIGKQGRVVTIDANNSTIEFKENIGGHTGSHKGKQGHCWHIPLSSSFLRKIKSTYNE